ncbi:signal peptidase I SipW [Rossellomorea sp. KS-H15a]|uniref:signal peptidase I SipW n=1 Tax=Rossellomorea sp. KS-H15a TaxID=2963940 RepID=UPI0020C6A50A|nr:signal peptidase I [Rossellomorea sp. KS-H15a]UTE77537.1 signal peptidase I [Rossellomorea sp. KS-H15a]
MNWKKALKIVNHFISTLLIIILLCSFYVMISSKVSGGQPTIFGNQLMLVLSGSMEPTIDTGSVVGVKEVKDTTNLKKGDIVTFYSPIKKNTIVTHRIIDVKGEGEFTQYITKGDNNETDDPRPVPSSKIIGKYSGINVPYVGYILQFLQSKNGIALSLILPGMIIIIYNIISLWMAFNREYGSKGKSKEERVA